MDIVETVLDEVKSETSLTTIVSQLMADPDFALYEVEIKAKLSRMGVCSKADFDKVKSNILTIDLFGQIPQDVLSAYHLYFDRHYDGDPEAHFREFVLACQRCRLRFSPFEMKMAHTYYAYSSNSFEFDEVKGFLDQNRQDLADQWFLSSQLYDKYTQQTSNPITIRSWGMVLRPREIKRGFNPSLGLYWNRTSNTKIRLTK